MYGKCLEELGRYKDAISQFELINADRLPQYHKNVVYISIARVYYYFESYKKGNHYFNMAIRNSNDKEKSILSSAKSILADSPDNESTAKILQEIAQQSPGYAQALEMFGLI